MTQAELNVIRTAVTNRGTTYLSSLALRELLAVYDASVALVDVWRRDHLSLRDQAIYLRQAVEAARPARGEG